MIWRHLFGEQIGRGARCLDIGCGSGLQAIQLALNGAEHVDAIDVAAEAADATLLNAFRNGVVDRVSVAAVDLFPWTPEARYDVIVASLFQAPVDPVVGDAKRPVDYWGRNAVDHVIQTLPRALADDGVAYVLQTSLLSQERTSRPARTLRPAGTGRRLRLPALHRLPEPQHRAPQPGAADVRRPPSRRVRQQVHGRLPARDHPQLRPRRERSGVFGFRTCP